MEMELNSAVCSRLGGFGIVEMEGVWEYFFQKEIDLS